MDVLHAQLPWIAWLQQTNTPVLVTFYKGLSFLGGNFYLLLLPLVYWLISKKRGNELFFLYCVHSTLMWFFKDLFATPRPFQIDHHLFVIREVGGGLPSGHMGGAIAMYGFMAYCLGKRAYLPSTILILLIGLSRIALGVHFPSDILAGAVMGCLLLFWFIRHGQYYSPYTRMQSKQVHLTALMLPLVICLLLQDFHAAITLGFASFIWLGNSYWRQLPEHRPSLRAVLLALGGSLGLFGLFIKGHPLLLSYSHGHRLLMNYLFGITLGLWCGFIVPGLLAKVSPRYQLAAQQLKRSY